MIGRSFHNYEVIRELGRGGMAVVYQARQASLNRVVALKVLCGPFARDAEFIERFRREAQAVGTLSHPNIVPVYDCGEVDGEQYMVMEYVEGYTLRELAGKGRSLPPLHALSIASQVLDALECAHLQGIVHRDVKPGNILVRPDGVTKLVDFGVAHSASMTRMTSTGSSIGTPEYMSPEQASGLPTDGRSDLYSCGVVLFELLTGRLPFTADTSIGVAYKHVHEPPPAIRSVNPSILPEVEAIVSRALCKPVDQRYQRARDMKADIDRVMVALASGQLPAVLAPSHATEMPRGDSPAGQGPPPQRQDVQPPPPVSLGVPRRTGGGRVWLAVAAVLFFGACAALIGFQRLNDSYFLGSKGTEEMVVVYRGVPGFRLLGYPIEHSRTDVKATYLADEHRKKLADGIVVTATEVPPDLLSALGKGLLAYDRGKYDEAAGHLKAEVDRDGSNVKALEMLARSYLQLGRKNEALVVLKQLAKVDPRSTWPTNTMGDVHFDRRELSQARDAYQQTLERNPKETHALARLSDIFTESGEMHLAKGYLAAAEEDFKTAIRYNQANKRAQAGLARVASARTQQGGRIVVLRAWTEDFNGSPKDVFSAKEEGVFVHVKVHNETPEIAHSHQLTTALYRPDGKQHGRTMGGTLVVSPGQDLSKKNLPLDIDPKSHNGFLIKDNALQRYPGRYTWVVYVDGTLVYKTYFRIHR